jgi:hypothetical protein
MWSRESLELATKSKCDESTRKASKLVIYEKALC